VTSDADGRVYVSDAGHALVKVYTLDGRLVRTLGGGTLAEPSGLAVAPDGTTYVADAGAARVHLFGRDGRGRGVVAGLKGLAQPRGLALADGYLLCADPTAGRVFMAEV
jgi:sugar lactone lactonase YvrE